MRGTMLERSRKARQIALILTSLLIVGIDCASAQLSPPAYRRGASSVRPPAISHNQQTPKDQSDQSPNEETANIAVAEGTYIRVGPLTKVT